jgi:hypothetical protein
MSDNKIHSKFGASRTEIYMNCPGAIGLIEKAPPSESGDAADEGTAAHMLGEKCLNEGLDPFELIGHEFNGYIVTDEMASAVKMYVDYAFARRQEVGGTLHVETRFEIPSIDPDLYGTNDLCIVRPGKRLIIADYKHGQDPVEAQNNKQLLFYALGAAIQHQFNFDVIEMVIIQPRAPHNEGPIRSWSVNKDYLVSWAKVLGDAVKLAKQKNSPLYRGSHCKWCPAKGICPKINEITEQALDIKTSSEVYRFPEIASLTDYQMVKILEHKKLMEDYIDGVQRAALYRLQQGEVIPGLKLVAGRGRRIWTDEKRAETVLVESLGQEAYTRDLLSVAQAEKKFPKDALESLISKIEGNETVAHESDRRKAIQPLAGKLILNNKRSV